LGKWWFKTILGKELARLHLNKQAGVVVHTYDPNYIRGIHKRTAVQTSWGGGAGENETPTLPEK
jgi:hypothetical protein